MQYSSAQQYKARHPYLCSWCSQTILKGEPYKKWTYFESGEKPLRVRFHLECAEALEESAKNHTGGDYLWCFGINERGIPRESQYE